MEIALIASTVDPASENIKRNLIENYDFEETPEVFANNKIYSIKIKDKKTKIYTIEERLIHSNNLDEEINADVFIFLSKHRAEEGRATLTVHPIGNWAKADYGGVDKKLCPCPCNFLKDIFITLSEVVEGTDYEATLEATHHGPFMKKPILFLELGSVEKHWNDPIGGKLTATALMNALSKETKEYETTFVIGGSHYGHVPNKTMLLSDFAVGHMLPKYAFEHLDKENLLSAIENTVPKPKFVLLDWKGLGKYKSVLLPLLEENNIEYKRSDQFFKTPSQDSP